MTAPKTRHDRVERLVKLVQARHQWSQRKLAEYMGCDRRSIAPKSGDVSLRIASRIAKALDWPIEVVAAAIEGDDRPHIDMSVAIDMSYAEASKAAAEAVFAGQYSNLVALSRRAFDVAPGPDERLMSCIREWGAWDSRGQYRYALETAIRGLEESDASEVLQLLMRSHLASSYYNLWRLDEARSIAKDLVGELRAFSVPPEDEKSTDEVRLLLCGASANYVIGQATRRLMQREPSLAVRHVDEAYGSLVTSIGTLDELCERVPDSSAMWNAIQHTCRGAMLELDVALKRCSAHDALETVHATLDPITDPREIDDANWLESYGWWCVFGCNIVLRHLLESEQQRPLAVLTNKASEIAEHLQNWALFERVFSLDYARRTALSKEMCLDLQVTIDNAELRVVLDLIGRFPSFRKTGWAILDSARVVEGV